jgi:hypothetical protein
MNILRRLTHTFMYSNVNNLKKIYFGLIDIVMTFAGENSRTISEPPKNNSGLHTVRYNRSVMNILRRLTHTFMYSNVNNLKKIYFGLICQIMVITTIKTSKF